MGGVAIRRILTSRLPDRFAGKWPRWSIEIAAGILVPVVLLALRLPLEPAVGERAPYAFNFVAVAFAAVIAGWRSGMLALALGQLLTAYVVVKPAWSFAIEGPDAAWGFGIATFSQAVLLLIIALYQREVDKGVAERERRLELQEHARREMDHRIRNNFQTVLALIRLQEQRSRDPAAKDALRQVGERLRAISSVTELLAIRSEDLSTVSVREHLCDLCDQLEQALADGIPIHCDVPEVRAGAVEATYLGIIVNELVTNAIKHAFGDGRSGWVRVEGQANGRAFNLVIRDNGTGLKASASRSGSGLGQKLVKTFIRELGAKHDMSSSDEGTVHRIAVPELVRTAA